MRSPVFRYIVRHKYSGNIEVKIYSLNQIEERPLKELSPAFHADYELLARDEFTGLKDRNGTEIYEGDIVRFEHSLEPDYDSVGQIEYKQQWCGFYFDGNRRLNSNMNIEVIGNIHQHSHPLEDAT
jgi:uncharacterized phage protein (TIGR01671 family)